MRTDSFSSEKHLPIRRFIADETKVATGLYGPRAIADDIDNIHAMFDPQSELLNGTEKGGIGRKNLQDGAVSPQKLQPELKAKIENSVPQDQMDAFRKEYDKKLVKKADSSATLSGYGIADAYTKSETDTLLEGAKTDVTNSLRDTVLYETVVNTPKWINQPTIDKGAIDYRFTDTDFYYVTLKDDEGNLLPAGQFRLKTDFSQDAITYPTVFYLDNLDTGFGTLMENYPVEFTSVTLAFALRDAGVAQLEYDIATWKLNEGTESLKTVLCGEIIPMHVNLFCYCDYRTDNQVACYHSTNGTTAYKSSATKNIIAYTPLTTLQHLNHRMYDMCSLRREGNDRFSFLRECFIKYSDTGTVVHRVLGNGNSLSKTASVEKVVYRMNQDRRGVIRNGTSFRIMEVK
ncbi:MAG: hypothetical protein J6A61_00505 [Clostridia bacterium]|nr:hypothetical protein [Clostridia bacterium]